MPRNLGSGRMSSAEDLSETGIQKSKRSWKSNNQSGSLLYSSCDEEGISNEESDGKEKSDMSSTHLIFVEDIKENSRVSVSGIGLKTKKRRSFHSGVEISKEMKIFKGRESIDDSFENFSQIQGKIRLKSDDSYRRYNDSSQFKNKGKACGPTVKRKKSLDIGVDQTKLSESIFKVFLKREEKIVRKKLVPIDVKQENKIRACLPNISSQNELKPTTKNSNTFLPPQAHEEIILPLPEENGEESMHFEKSETFADELSSQKPPRPTTPKSQPQGILKSAGSRRSVHWEEEVTLIHRSGSSESSHMSGEPEELKPQVTEKGEATMAKKEDKWRSWLEGIPLRDKSQSSKDKQSNQNTKIKNSALTLIKQCFVEPHKATNTLSPTKKSKNPEPHQKLAVKARTPISLSESQSSSADTISREFKRKTRPGIPLKRAASSESYSSCEGNKSKLGIVRRVSSPVIPTKRESSVNLILSNTCSAVEIRSREDSTSKRMSPDTSKSQGTGLRHQSGEKNIPDESDCRYEEVVKSKGRRSRKDTAKDVISFERSSGLRGNDSSAEATDALQECLMMVEKFRNLSPVHLQTKPEILNLIQEIQSNIKTIQDGIVNPPSRNTEKSIIKRKSSDKIKSVKSFSLEKEPSSKNHNMLDKVGKKMSSVKSAELLLEEKLYRACKLEPTSTPTSPLSGSNSRSSGIFKPTQGRSKLIVNKWKNTQKAISERSKRLLTDLRRGRDDDDAPEAEKRNMGTKKSQESSKFDNKIERKYEEVKKCPSHLSVDNRNSLVKVSSKVSEETASKTDINNIEMVSCVDIECTDQPIVSNIDTKEFTEIKIDQSFCQGNLSKTSNIEVNSEKADQLSQSHEENLPNSVEIAPTNSKSVESISNKFVLVGGGSYDSKSNEGVENNKQAKKRQSNLSVTSSETSESDGLSRLTFTSSCRSDTFPIECVYRSTVENTPRPPSRKPYFERDRAERGTCDNTRLSSVHHPTSSSPNESRSRPQPRMYSTLKESTKKISRISDITKEQLEADKRSLISTDNKSVSVKKSKSRGSVREVPWNCPKRKVVEKIEYKKPITDDDIKRVKYKFRKLLCSSPRSSTPKSDSSDRRPRANESPSSLSPIPNCPEGTLSLKPDSNSGSKIPHRKAEKTEHIFNALKDLAEATGRLKEKRSRSGTPRDVRRSRCLVNYLPPWERLNLVPNRDEKLKQEKRNLSSPNSRSHSNPPTCLSAASSLTTPRSLPGSPKGTTPVYPAHRQVRRGRIPDVAEAGQFRPFHS